MDALATQLKQMYHILHDRAGFDLDRFKYEYERGGLSRINSLIRVYPPRKRR